MWLADCWGSDRLQLTHAAWLAEAPSPTGSSGRPWCYVEPQACHASPFLWLREISGLRQLVAAGAESWGYCGAPTQDAGGSDRRRVLPVSQRQDGICWLALTCSGDRSSARHVCVVPKLWITTPGAQWQLPESSRKFKVFAPW